MSGARNVAFGITRDRSEQTCKMSSVWAISICYLSIADKAGGPCGLASRRRVQRVSARAARVRYVWRRLATLRVAFAEHGAGPGGPRFCPLRGAVRSSTVRRAACVCPRVSNPSRGAAGKVVVDPCIACYDSLWYRRHFADVESCLWFARGRGARPPAALLARHDHEPSTSL